MLAMNHFGDLTQDEYSFFYLGMRSHFSNETKRSGSAYLEPSHVSLPTEVDWRKEGYVTGVKNQGMTILPLFYFYFYDPRCSRSLELTLGNFVGVTAVSWRIGVELASY